MWLMTLIRVTFTKLRRVRKSEQNNFLLVVKRAAKPLRGVVWFDSHLWVVIPASCYVDPESHKWWFKQLVSCTHVGHLDWIPGSLLQPDLVLAIAGIWVSQWKRALSLSYLLFSHSPPTPPIPSSSLLRKAIEKWIISQIFKSYFIISFLNIQKLQFSCYLDFWIMTNKNSTCVAMFFIFVMTLVTSVTVRKECSIWVWGFMWLHVNSFFF